MVAVQVRPEDGRRGRSGDLVALVVDHVKAQIVSGTMASGERVQDSLIAKTMGVSRAPVREALRLLEQSGLLVKTPNKSYVVVQFDERDIYELTTLRMSLETLAAQLALGRPETLAALRAVMPRMARAVAEGDVKTAFRADREFHEALVRSADHRRLIDAYALLSDQVEMAYLGYHRRRPDISHLLPKHEKLLNLAEKGDVGRFIKELREHIRLGHRTVRPIA